jgi:uncharacterized protein YjbI with pentapeptide repeats
MRILDLKGLEKTQMRQFLLIAVSLFALAATANTAQAFKQKDLDKLLAPPQCIKCDLSGANLEGANLKGGHLKRANLREAKLTGAVWIDGRKCAKGSIGKCK